jgi:hypothetical protein
MIMKRGDPVKSSLALRSTVQAIRLIALEIFLNSPEIDRASRSMAVRSPIGISPMTR